MSEIRDSKVHCKITVANKKHRIEMLTGRFGSYAEVYEQARKKGYTLLSYTIM